MKSLDLHLGDHCLADEYRGAAEAIELQAATGGPLIATASALAADKPDLVALNQASMEAAGRKTGRSTMKAARTFSAKLQRAGGWGAMGSREQLDALHKGRYFASWLMVTGRLKVDATGLNDLDLQLGAVAPLIAYRVQTSVVGCRRALQQPRRRAAPARWRRSLGAVSTRGSRTALWGRRPWEKPSCTGHKPMHTSR